MDTDNKEAAVEKGPVKSIVPAKYSGKYKNGGSDPLAVFIKEQCETEGKFDYDKFFQLALANGVAQAEVDKYKAAYESKAPGTAGRVRMTIRNLMTPKARSADGMVGLDGKTYDVKLPPLPAREAKSASDESKAETADKAAA